MKCTLCHREAKERESFWTLEWKKVDIIEYTARKKDGRTIYISEVCPECMITYNNGKPPLGLYDLNKIRGLGITEEEYYKRHGY